MIYTLFYTLLGLVIFIFVSVSVFIFTKWFRNDTYYKTQYKSNDFEEAEEQVHSLCNQLGIKLESNKEEDYDY